MTDHISINEERLSETLNGLLNQNGATALTTQIIDAYMGGFHSNKGVPASISWNAQFGKYLKAHAETLGICEDAAGLPVTHKGDHTTTSRWKRI